MGYARTTDPATSHEAAERVNSHQLAVMVHQDLLMNGPSTSKEIAARLNLGRDSVSPRMPALREAGMVANSGERRDHQIVWRGIKK